MPNKTELPTNPFFNTLHPAELSWLREYEKQFTTLLSRWKSGWRPKNLRHELETTVAQWLEITTPQQLVEYITQITHSAKSILWQSIALTSEQEAQAYLVGSNKLELNVIAQIGSPLANRYGKNASVQFCLAANLKKQTSYAEIIAHFLGDSESLRLIVFPGLLLQEITEGKFKVNIIPN